MMSTPRALILSVAGLLALAPAAAGQASRPAKPKPDPAVKEAITQLSKALKDKKMARDAEASGLIHRLGNTYADGAHKKDAKAIVKAVGNVFNTGKLRAPQSSLYRVAADALGRMEDAGAKALQRAYEGRRMPNKRPWVPLRAHFLRRMGETRSLLAANFLAERVARASENEELAAAGEGLRHFADADQRLRKRLVKELVRKLGGLESAAAVIASPDPAQQQNQLAAAAARRTLAAVKRPWLQSLTALTSVSHKNGTDWQRWYNKNKARNWDR